MSSTVESVDAAHAESAGEHLAESWAPCRVQFTWFGTRKTLRPDQRDEAARTFGAEGNFLSAGKKLLDTRSPTWKALTGVKGEILAFWKRLTLPYPEPRGADDPAKHNPGIR